VVPAAQREVQKKNLIGLRVRWQWPQSHIDQAPHTREFRIYYQNGSLNACSATSKSVSAASTKESIVTTDIPNNESADRYVGAALYAGDDAFVIVASEARPVASARAEYWTKRRHRAARQRAVHVATPQPTPRVSFPSQTDREWLQAMALVGPKPSRHGVSRSPPTSARIGSRLSIADAARA
jgi:hypothetical protein